MDTQSFKEDHVSQIPTIQLLVNLGFVSVINQTLFNKVVGFIVQKPM